MAGTITQWIVLTTRTSLGDCTGLSIRLDDRLPGKDVTLINEYIDAGELGLALEQLADVLSEDDQPLAPAERGDMLALVERMRMAPASQAHFGSALTFEGRGLSPPSDG